MVTRGEGFQSSWMKPEMMFVLMVDAPVPFVPTYSSGSALVSVT